MDVDIARLIGAMQEGGHAPNSDGQFNSTLQRVIKKTFMHSSSRSNSPCEPSSPKVARDQPVLIKATHLDAQGNATTTYQTTSSQYISDGDANDFLKEMLRKYPPSGDKQHHDQ